MKQEHIGALLVVMSAACYGFMAIFVKFAYAGQANLATVLSGRFVLASLLLWLLVFIKREAAGITAGELGSLFLLSLVGYGISSTLFFAALLFIPASLASMILFIHPVMVSLYELVVYRYPLSLKKASALALSTAGLVLVLGNVGSGLNMRGVLLALGSATAYTVYLLYGKRILGRHSPVVITAYVLSFAAVGFTFYGLAAGEINPGLPAATWLWILYVAVISTCLGILFLFSGLKRLEAGRASIISTIEVVVTVCFSALLLGESITVFQAAGGIMILAGIIILRLEPAREQMPG